MRWLIVLGLLLGVGGILGCGSAKSPFNYETASQARTEKKEDRNDKDKPAGNGNQPPAPPPEQPKETVQRKIIYTAHVDLSAEKFEKAEEELRVLIKQMNAYLDNSEDSGSSGGKRTGSWTVRVPVDHFEEFMDEVVKIGELRRRTRDSQDVTGQYIDTEEQIKSDKVREESLRKLLEELGKKGATEEFFRTDSKLSDIRAKINADTRKLKSWDNQVSYSTVTVVITQRDQFEPVGTPGFGTTIARTWQGSLDALLLFGKGIVLVVVALTPWLVPLGLVTSPLWYLLWRYTRKMRPAKPIPPNPPTVMPA